MAKALFGHVGGCPDAGTILELRRLRQRVAELEREVDMLRSANAALTRRRIPDEEILTLSGALDEQREPAYT